MSSGGEVLFSIVVPCLNEEAYITVLLDTLSSQLIDADDFEIIVVDNSSTDRTAQTVWDFAAKSELNIRMVHEYLPGVSVARNSGASISCGSTIIFLDADNTLNSNFLGGLSQYIDRTRCAAGSIRTLPDEFNIKGWLVFSILEVIKIISPRPFGKSFVDRKLFFQSGGFNESIVLGENVEYLDRVKKMVKGLGGRFGHVRPGVSCSLRRFKKIGYRKILYPWFRAYIGNYALKYQTMVDINETS